MSTCFRSHSGAGRGNCNNGDDGGGKRPRLDGVLPSLSPSSDFLDVDPQQRLRRQVSNITIKQWHACNQNTVSVTFSLRSSSLMKCN